jgi:ubiquinone biosynthesis UbiH/UbiF/VisC/COQ6 family hydroxylase
MGVEFAVSAYAQHAIACRVDAERPHGQTASQWFSGSGSESEILAFLPRGGAAGNSIAIVWSVPAGRADQLMALAGGAFEEALGQASHSLLGHLRLTSERARWPLQSMRASRWVGPGWALAGDAAHNVHPLSGQGLNLGLADVAQLAQTLAQREYWRSLGDERLLRRYERARKADVTMMSWATDGLQRLFAHPDRRAQLLRNWGMSGFDRSGPIKSWAARQAMGHSAGA